MYYSTIREVLYYYVLLQIMLLVSLYYIYNNFSYTDTFDILDLHPHSHSSSQYTLKQNTYALYYTYNKFIICFNEH